MIKNQPQLMGVYRVTIRPGGPVADVKREIKSKICDPERAFHVRAMHTTRNTARSIVFSVRDQGTNVSVESVTRKLSTRLSVSRSAIGVEECFVCELDNRGLPVIE